MSDARAFELIVQLFDELIGRVPKHGRLKTEGFQVPKGSIVAHDD